MGITSSNPSRPGRPRALVAIAVALAVFGLAIVGFVVTHQDHAPQPSAAAAGTLRPTASSSQKATDGRSGGAIPAPAKRATPAPKTPPSSPVSIRIPSIGVSSEIIQVGVNPDKSIQIPQPGPDYDKAAWFKFSPTPGQIGPSIIEGHVDSAAHGPSVFFKLGALRPNDLVEVSLADHTVATFKVSGVRSFPKDKFPIFDVYGNTTTPDLRLITCGGDFDRSTGHYRSNIIAFASMVSRK
jgi:hypothetical protein